MLVRGLFRRAIETQEGNRKLTPEKVRDLRRMLDEGHSQSAVARTLGVAASTVGDVKNGRNWGWVK